MKSSTPLPLPTSGVPDGYSTLTPSLNLRGANEALVFYQRAFNAVERFRMPDAHGGVMHGEFQIGDSIVMFCDEDPASKHFARLAGGGGKGRSLRFNAHRRSPGCDNR